MIEQHEIKEDSIQEQIIQASKRLFQTHGLHKVTMDDVAKAIGKGRSSLYYYYKNKDEIFDAVIHIELAETFKAITLAVNNASTVEQKLRAYWMTRLKMLREKRAFYNTLDTGMDADALSHFNKIKIVHHNLVIKQEGLLLAGILTDGVKNGELSPIDEQEMDMLVFVLLSSLNGIKREMILANDYEIIEPAVNKLTSVIMNGLKK